MDPRFEPISLDAYVALHLKANPGVSRADLIKRLRYAAEASLAGKTCICGNPIWIVGSAAAGLMCFQCITGSAAPDCDYELILSENKA